MPLFKLFLDNFTLKFFFLTKWRLFLTTVFILETGQKNTGDTLAKSDTLARDDTLVWKDTLARRLFNTEWHIKTETVWQFSIEWLFSKKWHFAQVDFLARSDTLERRHLSMDWHSFFMLIKIFNIMFKNLKTSYVTCRLKVYKLKICYKLRI